MCVHEICEEQCQIEATKYLTIIGKMVSLLSWRGMKETRESQGLRQALGQKKHLLCERLSRVCGRLNDCQELLVSESDGIRKIGSALKEGRRSWAMKGLLVPGKRPRCGRI